eukprot:584148-Amphidinium_carterae.1
MARSHFSRAVQAFPNGGSGNTVALEGSASGSPMLQWRHKYSPPSGVRRGSRDRATLRALRKQNKRLGLCWARCSKEGEVAM